MTLIKKLPVMPKLPKIAEIEIPRYADARNWTIRPKTKFWQSLAVLAVLAILFGCKSQPSSENAPAQKAGTVSVDPATAGSISGVVSFKGAPPKLRPLDMTQDPACPSGPQPADGVMISGGRLADVFIYIKEGLPQGTFAVPNEAVVLDQKGCRYVPHVLGMMTGQELKILNSDKADHNIHSMSSNNPMWNESQTSNSKPVIKTFANPEMMIPVQCNQHPWMRAYINVMPHPYFAVTAADGSFSIKNLPPGEYTLAAVHEKFGEQTLKVKVGPKMDSDARFTFSAQ
jgi:plastocyanin